MTSVEFDELIGLHKLSGVSFEQFYDNECHEDAQVCNFILDGVTYTATEDPSDGYRSSMRSLIVSDKKLKNMFKPVKVLVARRENHTWQKDDILDFTDVITAKIVLSIGTENTDDCYPSFVAWWRPENLVHNKDVKPETAA